MNLKSIFHAFNALEWRLVGAVILGRAVLQLSALPYYGYFIDEYYYLACAARPDFGYVDHAPLSVWMLSGVVGIFGDSLWALRMPMVLAGALTIYLSARLARELGGGTLAVFFTALLVALTPIYLGFNKFYSMNSWEVVFWVGAFLQTTRVLRDPRPREWALLGFVLGLGLLNKHSVLFLGFGLAVGLIATRARRLLLTPGPYIAGIIAFVIFAPHLIWQFQNGWPTLEFMENARAHKNFFTVGHFLVAQILENHPLFALVWLLGLFALLFGARLAEFRMLGVVYLALLGLFLFTGAKSYYLAPAYTLLFAAGALEFEALSRARPRTRLVAVPVMLLAGLALVPMSLPVLGPERYIAYENFLGLRPPKMEKNAGGRLPQHFADMFGWDELRAEVKRVHGGLPPADRKEAVILASNYGFAGALEFRRAESGLPPVLSPHNNFHLWATRGDLNAAGSVYITAGFKADDLRKYFDSVEEAGVARCEYCLASRRESKIYICRGPREEPAKLWPRLKRYI